MGRLDIEATLLVLETRLNAIENKRLSARDWVEELLTQTMALIHVCQQQQKEIERLSNGR
jgi:hypothetical protein